MTQIDPFFQPKKAVNRISGALNSLEISDTTVLQAQLHKALKASHFNLRFLKYMNGALWGLIACCGCYLLLEVFVLRPKALVLPEGRSVIPTANVSVRTGAEEPAEWESFQGLMARRSIFEPVVAAVDESQKAAIEEDILKKIKIVGVFIDRNPKAIMEIIATGETVFVSIGESVAGATIKEILENKVVLSYNGAVLELLR